MSGTDPVAYILSANIHRRDMNKGQQAMAVARLYPQAEKGGRGQKAPEMVSSVAQQRISQARIVLQFAPDLADGVMDGSVTLAAMASRVPASGKGCR